MINWTILMAVKGLKVGILAALALISHVADVACPSAVCAVEDSATVAVVLLSDERVAVDVASIRVAEDAAVAVVVATDSAARIRHLVPPVRVEMTFTPDLLRPPKRDPSL